MSEFEIPTSFAGMCLIASPYLQDPNFRGTVIHLAGEYNDGILGLILNRKTQGTIAHFWRSVFGTECTLSANVFMGGPVPGPLAVLHQASEYGDMTAGPDFYLTFEKPLILELVNNGVEPLKFFLGQSGWTRDQLIGEIENGYWHLLPPGQSDPFADDTDLWPSLLQKAAGRNLARLLGLGELPDDPELN